MASNHYGTHFHLHIFPFHFSQRHTSSTSIDPDLCSMRPHNTEHLQEHLQAIDERLSAVESSRGRLSNRSRVGTIVDTSPPSVAQSVISRDPVSSTDSLMSRDQSPSPVTQHHTGSFAHKTLRHPHPPTVVLLLLLHSTLLAEVPRGCALPNGAPSNVVWLAVPILVVPILLSQLPSLHPTHDQRFALPPHLMFLSFGSMDAQVIEHEGETEGKNARLTRSLSMKRYLVKAESQDRRMCFFSVSVKENSGRCINIHVTCCPLRNQYINDC
jgi:hypothetical protein